MTGRQTAGERRPRHPKPSTDAGPAQGRSTLDLHAPAQVLGRNADAEFWRSYLTESVRRTWGADRATVLATMIERMAGNAALVMSEAVAFVDDPFDPVNMTLPAVPTDDRKGAASGPGGHR